MRVLAKSLLSEAVVSEKLYCSLNLVADNYCIRLKEPKVDSFFKKSGAWQLSNEPDGHLPTISDYLISLDSIERIIGFSYKDISLMKLFCLDHSALSSAVLITGENGTSSSSPESIVCFEENLNANDEKYDLLIMRHYLEHSQDPAGLLRAIARFIRPGGYIYIEVPAIERFLEAEVPLFLWEQHRSYFTSEDAYQMCERIIGPCIYCETHGHDIEPSHCIVARYDHTLSDSITHIDDLTKRIKIVETVEGFSGRYFRTWEKYLKDLNFQKCFLGIGHTAERFLQLTKSVELFDTYADSSSEKIGRKVYPTEKIIADCLQIDLGSFGLILLGVHDRDVAKLSATLRDDGFSGIIGSIYTYPE